ncbi:response regulator transcription factor [Paenibacillus sp. CAU 1782]
MKAAKLLIVEDDLHISEIVTLYAEKAGHQVIAAYDGIEGLVRFYDESPDLIILDLMLPEMEGWSLCREVRKHGGTPVIILSAKTEPYDKMKGFELGADDYVVKPFDPQELMARIMAVLRRASPDVPYLNIVQLNNLTIDMNQYLVLFPDATITLPPKELELLYFFCRYPNRLFTRQQLLEQVWGYEYEGDHRTVDVHIKRIREKLRARSSNWSITTKRGIGYKLEEVSGEVIS